MSHRHDPDDLRDRAGIAGHQRSERQRIKTDLHSLCGPVADDEVDDLDDPGPAYRTEAHHRPERAAKSRRDRFAHWKQKAWKRRTLERARRVAAEEALRAQP